jgi:hypothetical protein
MFKTPHEWADAVKSLTPQININKNGYEIRTQVLEMAKNQVEFEFGTKYQEWEHNIVRDPKTSKVTNIVKMPSPPGVSEILETAEKFYEFVNQKPIK